MDNVKKKKKKSAIAKRLFFLYTFILMIAIAISASIITYNKSKTASQLSKKQESLATNNTGKISSTNDETTNTSVKSNSEEQSSSSLTKEQVQKIAEEDYRLILVNKDFPLDNTYKPNDLVTPNVKRLNSVTIENRKLRKDAARALETLFKDAKKEKINLVLVSGYRSYESQTDVYERKVKSDGEAEASKYVANPGTSEHQTGLAVDVNSSPYYDLAEDFAKTKEGKWLADNSYKYGFVIRYLQDKTDVTGYNYEPWHLRYVGEEVAKDMQDNNLCLEEYVEKLASAKK